MRETYTEMHERHQSEDRVLNRLKLAVLAAPVALAPLMSMRSGSDAGLSMLIIGVASAVAVQMFQAHAREKRMEEWRSGR